LEVADFEAVHAVDRYWLVAEALGVGDRLKEFLVPVHPQARDWAKSVLHGCLRPWLLVGVGSRWITKRWLPRHFATLLNQAQAAFGGTAIFIGAGDEVDVARETADLLKSTCNFTGKTTLPQLAALLEQADVMVANDTGPLHLAAALGRPVVAPYTCTKVRLNGPYGADGGAVESRIWCQGSYLKHCPRLECMTELTPDRLWPVLHGVLEKWEARSRSA
jgi:ADP-heptose:LPS heptosyltransferase